MSNEQRIKEIHRCLSRALSPSHLEIIDDSHKHIGHAGAASGAGHFTVVVASSAFKDKRPLACHRLIYDALDHMIPNEIHALSIKIGE